MIDDQGAIPDDQDTDTSMPTGDDGSADGMDVIQQVLDYGRKMNGIQFADAGGGSALGPNTQSNDNSEGAWTGSSFQRPQPSRGPLQITPGKFDPRQFMRQQGKNYAEGGPVDDDNAIPVGDADPVTVPIPQDDQQGAIPDDQAAAASDETPSFTGQLQKGIQQATDTLQPIGQAMQGAIASEPTPVTDAMQGGLKRFMRYLTGDAERPEVVAQAEAAVDPSNQMSPGDKKIATIKSAVQQGGPEVGWRFLQSYRQKYEALRQSAAAVADGTQDRPGDPAQAAQLATQAYTNVPDGTDVHFVASKGGFTATVTSGDKVLAQVPLSPQQFRQFIAGPHAQFDYVMETSPAVALQKIAGGGDQQASADNGQQQPAAPQAAPGAFKETTEAMNAMGKQPAGKSSEEDDGLEISNMSRLNTVANRLFPYVGQADQRNRWIAAQIEKAQQYGSAEKVAQNRADAMRDVAGVKAEAGIARAHTTGEYGLKREGVRQSGENTRQDTRTGAYRERTTSNADIARERMRSAEEMSRERNASTFAGKVAGNPLADPKTFEKAMGRPMSEFAQPGAAPPQAPTPQAPTPQAGGQQNTRIINGHQYMKVPGGWKRVQ